MKISTNDEYPLITPENHHLFIAKKLHFFYFHFTRCSQEDLLNLSSDIHSFFCFLKDKSYLQYIDSIHNIICFTRDSYIGKGERDLTYMLICIFYKHFPENALLCIPKLPVLGSWADIKYFCSFVRLYGPTYKLSSQCIDILINHAVNIITFQINYDYNLWNNTFNEYLISPDSERPNAKFIITNAAKWVPREKSKHGWLFDKIIHCYFENYNVNNFDLHKRRGIFRKIISLLSKELDVLERKLCNSSWADIEYKNITLHGFIKNNSALLHGRSVYTNAIDRDLCKEFMIENIHDTQSCDSMKKKNINISIGKLTKMGLDLLKRPYTQMVSNQMTFVNKLWNKIINKHERCKKYILPIMDSSINLSDKTFNEIIGMSLFCGSISELKRIVIFKNNTLETLSIENDNFIDLLRNFVNFDRSIFIEFSTCIEKLYSGFNYLNKPLKIIYFSNNKNIFSYKNLELISNKYTNYIFWNIDTCDFDTCDFESFENLHNEGVKFLSGSCVNLIYTL